MLSALGSMLDWADGGVTIARAEDLTEEVAFTSIRPAFIGTYSLVYKGACRGQAVSDRCDWLLRAYRRMSGFRSQSKY